MTLNYESLIKENNNYVLNTYGRKPVCFVKGKSATLTDINNKKYIDFLSGLGVNNLGYGHPVLENALKDAAKNVWHTSNLFLIQSQIELAKLIQKKSFKGKTFFCNSGTEANEAAYKLAMKYGKYVSPPKKMILSLTNSFHGRTMASLSLTGQAKYQDNFKPLLPVIYCNINNLAELEKKLDYKIAALFIEIIQGEGGVNPVSPEFLKKARELCDENNALLVIDEVQTGCGRTGKTFAYQHYDVMPDIITAAKAMAGGIPIGCMHVSSKLTDILVPGDHASTFGGNPLATTVALKAFSILSDNNFLKEVKSKAAHFSKKIKVMQNDFKFIKEVRQIGLMIGIQLDPEYNISANSIAAKAFDNKLIINSIHDSVIRMLPPLVVSEKEIDQGLNILYTILKKEIKT